MKKTFSKFEFTAPVAAAFTVVALTAFTAFASGPGDTPPDGNVDAKFSSVAADSAALKNITVGPVMAGDALKVSGKSDLGGTIYNSDAGINGGEVRVVDSNGLTYSFNDATAPNFRVYKFGVENPNGVLSLFDTDGTIFGGPIMANPGTPVTIKSDDGLEYVTTTGNNTTFKVANDGSISNPSANNGGAIAFADSLLLNGSAAVSSDLQVGGNLGATGWVSGATLSTTGVIIDNANISAVGHLKAASIGDYQTVSLTGGVTPTGGIANVSMGCPANYQPISCGFSSFSQWSVMRLLPSGNACEFTGVNAGPNAAATVWGTCFNSNI